MKKIKGYVFIAGNDKVEILFGMPSNNVSTHYENFEINGMVPYSKISCAKKAMESLSIPDLSQKCPAKLYMEIAENEDELYSFRNDKDLIVVMKDESYLDRKKFFGPINLNKKNPGWSSVPGTELSKNGYIPWNHDGDMVSFDRILYQLTEINRQIQCPATIAKFKLERILI
jgi:hypothetical protein